MRDCDEMFFEKLCNEFKNNLKESKKYISPSVIHEFRRSAREYSINVFTSETYSEESFGDQGVRSDSLVAANIHGDFDLLLRNAFISEQLGEYCFENYDKPDESISHLLDALFLLSSWVGSKIKERYKVETVEVELNRRLKAREDGGLGGRERAKKYMPVKVELIRLLFEKAPIQGWESVGEAILAIEKGLFKFIVIESDMRKSQANYRGDDNTLLLWDNLHETISRWIKEDEFIKSVFDNTKRT